MIDKDQMSEGMSEDSTEDLELQSEESQLVKGGAPDPQDLMKLEQNPLAREREME